MRSRVATANLAAALLFSVCGTHSAFAQPSDAAVQARVHAERGEALLNVGNYAAALREYEAAYELFSAPLLLLNIAAAQEGLGRLLEAIERLDAALQSPDLPAGRRDDVSSEIERIQRKLAVLVVEGSPAGSVVLVNGVSHGITPLRRPLRLNPGQVNVEVRKRGYASARRRVTLRSGARRRVAVDLEPEGVASSLDLGPEPQVPVAAHVEDTTLGSTRRPLEVPEGVRGTSRPARGVSPVWVFVSGGAALAMGIAVAYFGIDYLGYYDDPAAEERWGRDNKLVWVFGVGAAVSAVACIVLVRNVRWSDDPASEMSAHLGDVGSLHF